MCGVEGCRCVVVKGVGVWGGGCCVGVDVWSVGVWSVG